MLEEYLNGKDPTKLNREDIVSFLESRSKSGISNRSNAHMITVLRGFYKFLLISNSLSKIQNAYWHRDEDADRFNKYWKRILQRAQYVAEDPLLRTAYQLFLDRQLTCPKTLSIGDCLQENLISQDGIVYLVDWGFGGIMPYSLDIARFIAHGSEERKPFPYYITAHQKELFIDSLYEKLNQKPDKDVFIRDIKLSVLNEYIEFMEADEDIDGWYSLHARNLAQKY